MFKYFDNIPLDDEEKLSEERVENIKTSVLSRITKEENAMSKRTTIKTITIAVAAATTAALSAMIASAEQSAWTPAAEVENTVENAAETEMPEVTEDNTIDNEKPGEAAFKEYIEKAKAEDDGTPKETPEIVNGWVCGWGEASYKEYKEKGIAENEDYICIQPADDPNVFYYYYKMPNEELQEKLKNGWTLLDEDINVIHENEVFAVD